VLELIKNVVLKLPFDPVQRAKEVEKVVCKDYSRKYYRFRFSKYYGGIVTADAVGCCFLCAYCWNFFRNLDPGKYGEFYSSEEVAEILGQLVAKRRCYRVRISGAEPILGEKSFDHLLRLLKILGEMHELVFILETNGLMLGYHPEFCRKLAKLGENIFVRVSLKGWDERSFETITGARGEFFRFPLLALKNLRDLGVNAWPAVMYDIFRERGIEEICKKLKEVGVEARDLELEYLELYSFVKENMKRRGLTIL